MRIPDCRDPPDFSYMDCYRTKTGGAHNKQEDPGLHRRIFMQDYQEDQGYNGISQVS